MYIACNSNTDFQILMNRYKSHTGIIILDAENGKIKLKFLKNWSVLRHFTSALHVHRSLRKEQVG